MNPREEFDKLHALADAARLRGDFALAEMYDSLASIVFNYEPQTVRRALELGVGVIERERR